MAVKAIVERPRSRARPTASPRVDDRHAQLAGDPDEALHVGRVVSTRRRELQQRWR
jgi:hypothetical protein